MDLLEKMIMTVLQDKNEILLLLEEIETNIYKNFLNNKNFEEYLKKKEISSKIKKYIANIYFFVEQSNQVIIKMKEELDIQIENNKILSKANKLSNINYEAMSLLYEKIINSYIKK